MNADRELSIKQRILWMLRALSNYIKSLFIKKNIKITENISLDKKIKTNFSTPSRVYTENLIYNYIPWNELKNELVEISICEFGCGNLRYLKAFDKLLGKGNYNYIGIEAPSFVLSKEAKDLLDDKIQFINYDFNKGVPDNIKNCNIFLSISVLEHIDEIDFFAEMYSTKVPEISYHYHFFPTFLSVFNYLWHGCRHFNSLELRELLKYFNHEKAGIIYYGGFISLVFHMIFITSIDLISKIFKINYKFKLFNFNLVRLVVKIFENVDNFTAKMGIHTFCLLYWRSKK